MRSVKYITEKTIRFEVNRLNEVNKALAEVLEIITPIFNDQLVGKKIRSTTNNSFLKKLKIETRGQVGEWTWTIHFDSSGYASLRLTNHVKERYLTLQKEYTVLRTDNEGFCTKVFDLNNLYTPHIDADEQCKILKEAQELEEQLTRLTNQLINF